MNNEIRAGISREPSFILIALFLALGAYIALAILLLPPPAGSPLAELIIPEFRHEIVPEPQEKFLYVFGLFSILTLPGLFYWLLMRWNRRFEACFSGLERRATGDGARPVDRGRRPRLVVLLDRL